MQIQRGLGASKLAIPADFNGDFVIKTNIPLPFSIEVSYIGYDSKVIDLIDNQRLKVGLKSKDLQLKADR